jgi:hypothetical protein
MGEGRHAVPAWLPNPATEAARADSPWTAPVRDDGEREPAADRR